MSIAEKIKNVLKGKPKAIPVFESMKRAEALAMIQGMKTAEVTRYVKADPRYISVVEKPTDAQMRAALAHGTKWVEGLHFNFPNEKFRSMCIEADPELIKWVIKPSDELLCQAVMANPNMLWVAGDRKEEIAKMVKSLKRKGTAKAKAKAKK